MYTSLQSPRVMRGDCSAIPAGTGEAGSLWAEMKGGGRIWLEMFRKSSQINIDSFVEMWYNLRCAVLRLNQSEDGAGVYGKGGKQSDAELNK